jgi:hypothetical protein
MHTQDFTIVLNKFDTGSKRLSSGIRDLCSGGLVATKLIVRASPYFTLKAYPLYYPPPLRHFPSEPKLYYPESYI